MTMFCAAESRSGEGASSGRPPRVMIVDDDEAFREAIAAVLEEAGYDVIQAQDGEEAAELLDGGAAPNVMLLDLMMPVMNGWQLIDHITERDPHINLPIILISAYPASMQTLAWKVAASLIKPVPRDVLIATIERIVKP